METIGVIGIGRLGICLALNIERSGYRVIGIDKDEKYIKALQAKTLISAETDVENYLKSSTNFTASTDLELLLVAAPKLIFVCVPTPSKADGSFDHTYVDEVANDLLRRPKPTNLVTLIINATVMPGYCDALQKRMEAHNYDIVYNPEFIAQGTIIYDQQYPDQVLIGTSNSKAVEEVEAVYQKICKNEPVFSSMSRTEAEITKLAVNCFLTTKIAFANAIGDLAQTLGADQNAVLNAIGSDSRIGNNFLKYGFGYGGPCLPRDNRAIGKAASNAGLNLPISRATDESNQLHLEFQAANFAESNSKEQPIVFESLSYKSGSDIIEESQSLALAVKLAQAGFQIRLKDRKEVIDQIAALHGELFTYELSSNE